MKRQIKALTLLLALTLLTACGTSTGASGGVGATGAATADTESSAPRATERDAPVMTGYDRLFRDNDGYHVRAKSGLDDSGMVLGDGFRVFDSFAPALVSDGSLPALDGFPPPGIWARYNEERGVETVSVSWTTANADGYVDRHIGLYAWPETPDTADPYWKPYQEGRVTYTDMEDITVIGAGTPDTPKLLYLTLADGTYCQIEANDRVSAGEMGAALDFLLKNGFDFSEFDYDSGEPLKYS